jgi:hypothetical protein
MNKKDKILLVGFISALLVSLASYLFFKKYKINIYYSILPFAFILLLSISLSTDKKYDNSENYKGMNAEDRNISGCNQTINIIQNCDDNKPKPPSPPSSQLNKMELLNWIESINNKLTVECKNCIVNSAMKLWNMDSFEKIKNMNRDEQTKVLYAVLSFDCDSLCSIKPENLNKNEVISWVRSVNPGLPEKCLDCVVLQIVRMWNVSMFQKVKNMAKNEQSNIVEGLLAMNCQNCRINNRVDENSVRKWLNGLLKQDSECIDCLVDKIVSLWDLSEYFKVVNMNIESQKQIVNAIMMLSCSKDCVVIPNKLTENEVRMWVRSILTDESDLCLYCIVKNIMNMWNYEMFKSVQRKSIQDQFKIIHGLIILNCSECITDSLTKNQVLSWLKTLAPSEYKLNCLDCIASAGVRMWTKRDFSNLLSKPTSDQIKVLKNLADYNCPHPCPNVPIEYCNYDY